MPNSGLVGELEPPTAGYAWQLLQELELKRGPKPTVFTNGPPATKFTSVKIWVSRVPMALWFFVRVVKKAPAAARSGRGPGSVAVGQGEIGHELPLTTAGRDIKAAMDK